ncbi:hypothetical protein ACFFHH_12560 [Cytobacillus solani]|uniref:hypothetical protein n=1 Tax=Cytobacillus solani TaxID=1637975 RepID=UPI0006AB85FC|nr:hypothetical protein [Cytobacillus solani]
MANLEGMNMKFTIIKNEDIEKLPEPQRANLREVHEIILKNRLVVGKRGEPKYLVNNTDEPYVDQNGHWG